MTNITTHIFTFMLYIITAFNSLYCKNEIKKPTEEPAAVIITAKDSTIKKDSVKNIFEFHYASVLVDSHNDYLYQIYRRGADFGKRDNFTQTGLRRMQEGGVDVQIFAIWIPPEEKKRATNFTFEQIDRLKTIEKEHSSEFEIAYSYDDIMRIVKEGKIAALSGIEDGVAVGNDLGNINRFYKLGIRYIGLTWNDNNQIGTSSKEERKKGTKGGLTKFGFEVVKKMDEIGMLIDVSHLGEGAFWDVIKTTKNPIIASHSCCYALNPHHRNLTDEQIKAIAERNGVIMINFLDDFIDANAKSKRTGNMYQLFKSELDDIYDNSKDLIEFNEKRYEFMKEKEYIGGTTVDDLIDHIDYIKKIAGIDYIGLGSDFDGGITPPVQIYDGTCYPVITKRLQERGYTFEEIEKILGLNFLRVFKQVCK